MLRSAQVLLLALFLGDYKEMLELGLNAPYSVSRASIKLLVQPPTSFVQKVNSTNMDEHHIHAFV